MLTLLEWIYTLVLVLSQLHLDKAGCDEGVQLSFRPSVRSTVNNNYSCRAPVITASVKHCTVLVLYILFKHTACPSVIDLQTLSIFYVETRSQACFSAAVIAVSV